MKLLENKTALITGASRGIGEAIALKFAEAGANVAFTYLSSEAKALALEEKLNSFGIKAKGYKSNAGVYAEAEQLIVYWMNYPALLPQRVSQFHWFLILNTDLTIKKPK